MNIFVWLGNAVAIQRKYQSFILLQKQEDRKLMVSLSEILPCLKEDYGLELHRKRKFQQLLSKGNRR